MGRPESERRYLRQAVKDGYLTVDHASAIIAELERRREGGLHAIRDIAIRTGKLTEKVAYALFQRVSKDMREVPQNIRRIGGFEVLGPLGKGSMSVVFQARQLSLDKVVALKVLPPGLSEDPVFQERFLREARAVAKLNHPNIVAALDAGKADGYHYFAMEHVDGSTVRDIVAARGPIDEREALKVAYFVARALKHAHAGGIIHRDVKPANIMLTRDGKVKLTDLGLARIENDPKETHLTEVGKSVGTPYYMSPEQARRGKVADTRADIYALGATLFYMLTGRPPFDGETPSMILEKHVKAPIPDPRAYEPDLHERTAIIVRRALAKRPEERYQTPGEMASAIKAVLQGRSPNSPDPEAEQIAPRRAPAAPAPTPTPRPSAGPAGGHGDPRKTSGRHASVRASSLPPVAREGTAAVASAPSLPSLPALPQLPEAPWPQAQQVYVAQAPVRRGSQSNHGVSSMTLTPVWLDPVTGRSTLGQANRARRRAPRRKDESSIPLLISLVVALVGVGAGALIAFSGGDKGAPEVRAARGGTDRSGEARTARAGDGAGSARAGASGGGRAAGGARRSGVISLDEENRLRAEAMDRAEEERLRNDPVAAEAARLAKLARKNAQEAEELRQRSEEDRKRREARAQEELAKGLVSEGAQHQALLSEVAQRMKAEDLVGAARLLDQASQRYGTQSVKARAELDLAGVRQVETLAEMAKRGLEKRKGQKERLEFQKKVTLEGEVIEVTASGEVALRPTQGGRLVLPVRELTLYEQRRLSRLAAGERSGDIYAAEGLFYLYAAEMQKARTLLERASREGVDVKIYLDRLAEIEAGGGIPTATAPGKEVATGPTSGPSSGSSSGAPEGEGPGGEDDWERAPGTPGGAGASTGASPGAGERRPPEKGPPPVERLTEEILLRIFEYQPKTFTPDGQVRFQYALMEQKRLPSDFALEGGDLRFDADTLTLRLEGPPRRLTHKAIFVGPVNLEVQLAFPRAPDRSSAVVLFAEDALLRESTIQSIFGLDVVEKRKGKTASKAGPQDPIEQAIRETKTMMAYRYHLHVDALTLAGVDGGTRARIEGVDVEGTARRVGVASAGINAQLRSVEIEGRLDLRWVAKELQKKPLLGPKSMGPGRAAPEAER